MRQSKPERQSVGKERFEATHCIMNPGELDVVGVRDKVDLVAISLVEDDIELYMD